MFSPGPSDKCEFKTQICLDELYDLEQGKYLTFLDLRFLIYEMRLPGYAYFSESFCILNEKTNGQSLYMFISCSPLNMNMKVFKLKLAMC